MGDRTRPGARVTLTLGQQRFVEQFERLVRSESALLGDVPGTRVVWKYNAAGELVIAVIIPQPAAALR